MASGAYIVGLTGVIGAGKTTVARMLADRGAVVLDGDRIGHEIYEPGTEAHRAIVEEFGAQVVGPDGRIERPRLAAIVFSDPERLQRLNEITHPRIYARADELARQAPPGSIVVYDMQILDDRSRVDTMIVVAAGAEASIEHLATRGMAADEARRRMASQPSVGDKLKLADHVIWNEGAIAELERRVDEVWCELESAARARTAS